MFVCASRPVWCAGKKRIGRLAEREIFGLFLPVGAGRQGYLYKLGVVGRVCEQAEHVLGEEPSERGNEFGEAGSCVLGPWKFRPRILLGQDHTNVRVTSLTWAALEAKLYGNST